MNLPLIPEQIRIAVNKCVTNTESELKYKHVRLLLLHTHRPDHYVIIWENFIVLSRIKVNSIAAFKFCHLLHRLLRDGSSEFLVHSERCLFVLQNFEKDWMTFVTTGQLDVLGYLLCSVKYCHYLMDKIVFHAKYKHVSGNFSMSNGNIDIVTVIDNYRRQDLKFSSVEFTTFTLKLLEGIIDVQNLIFANIHPDTIKPETVLCRLLALIPLIEDAKKLYYIAVQSLHYIHLYTTYGGLKDMQTRLYKIFPGIRQFFRRCQGVAILEGKVWIPQMSDSPPKFENSSLLVSVREYPEPSAPPYYYQPAPTAPPLQHSISVQPSTSSNPTLNRNISDRIVALQKQVVVPKPVVVQNQAVIQKQFVGSKPKIDIESKPLPPIPVASNNNRQVYEDDENIYEELEPRPEYDDEYFSDSDFDSTDYEDEIDSASESTKNATKEEFKRQYENNSFQDDPLRNLQKVLLTGKQASSSQNNVNKREVPQMSPVQHNISKRGEPERTSDIEVIDVPNLLEKIKALELEIKGLKMDKNVLSQRNKELQEENSRLKLKTNGPVSKVEYKPEIRNKENLQNGRPSGSRNKLRDSVMYFESINSMYTK